MWSLFPELLGPMVIAFVLGSILAWALVGLVLPRRPSPEALERPLGTRGP